ncbi:putative quinol monooxygenase [Ancylobacter defluvii]|uniref:Antibiotic biosynthesis monooxygenase n=1 Tax=Ancylobacter defluvii TaxID=1282440 RepID=A0A9W6JS68_9HYPH|nr:putative quinol monooxygenase [Ancylobacter defluvii]MBS7590170.1 antibiotic biosynthesis monooxygenase [Ancylobacter defluvii]GLK82801.1 antibiotic biosynthesis monooxygenase [Ancylobacter defluvii]
MAELTNAAFFNARSGRSDELGSELLKLVSPSRQEKGCLRYEIHQSKDDPHAWMVLEDWRQPSDFDLHMASDYVRAFMAKVPELCVGKVEICAYRQVSPQY